MGAQHHSQLHLLRYIEVEATSRQWPHINLLILNLGSFGVKIIITYFKINNGVCRRRKGMVKVHVNELAISQALQVPDQYISQVTCQTLTASRNS